MSIVDLIRWACSDGTLVEIEPLLPAPQPRVMFAVKSLAEAISAGASADEGSFAYRIGQLSAEIDHFSGGRLMTVGYGRERSCRLKPLDPASEEVWELRSRSPKPSLRVFGRFAERNVFVATHMARRDGLGEMDSREWAEEIRRCKSIWRQLFLTYNPVSGANIDDYLSNVIEVGNLP